MDPEKKAARNFCCAIIALLLLIIWDMNYDLKLMITLLEGNSLVKG